MKKFFGRLRAAWAAKTTEQKVCTIVDFICGFGTSTLTLAAGDKLCEGLNPIQKAGVRIAGAGLSIAAGDVAAKALKDNFAKPIANTVDMISAKVNRNKEAGSDE